MESPRDRHDVFLSHNSKDKPTVERIAVRLKQVGLEPWLDVWSLTPGGRWQAEIAAWPTERAPEAAFGTNNLRMLAAAAAGPNGFRALVLWDEPPGRPRTGGTADVVHLAVNRTREIAIVNPLRLRAARTMSPAATIGAKVNPAVGTRSGAIARTPSIGGTSARCPSPHHHRPAATTSSMSSTASRSPISTAGWRTRTARRRAPGPPPRTRARRRSSAPCRGGRRWRNA
jgi:TIR domain